LESANRHMEMALASSDVYDQQYAMHNRGLANLYLGRKTAAHDTAVKLRDFIEEHGMYKELRYYHHLMGKIDLAEGKPGEAVGQFRQALKLLPQQTNEWDNHARFLYALGEALYEEGDLEEARKVFHEISLLNVGRLTWGDLYSRSFYMLGKIGLARGENREAVSRFEEFISLWDEADPGIEELKETRRELEAARASIIR